MHHGAVSPFDALPAVVAVHGVVAPYDGGDMPDAKFAHLLLKLADEVPSTMWRRIASVHEAMYEHTLDLVPFGHLQQCKKVLDMRVHAPVAEQSDKMELVLAAPLHRVPEQLDLL